MKKLALGIGIIFILKLVGIVPASASVTKDTHTYIWSENNTSVQIAQDMTGLCDLQNTEIATEWNNPATGLPIWKMNSIITIEGMCDDGTRIECAGHFVDNAQNLEVGTLNIGVFIISDNCWFYYSDGTKAKMMRKNVYANDEYRVFVNGRWN
jgi:hypothetical protein